MSDYPRIEYPCDYPIRIIGDVGPVFHDEVLAIVRAHAEVVDGSVNVQESRNGTYCSIRVTIVATGEPQIKVLHEALVALPRVRMVL